MRSVTFAILFILLLTAASRRVGARLVEISKSLPPGAKIEVLYDRTALVDHVLEMRATQMLREEGLSVSEVAFRLGYNDVSNFSRAFRRWTGQSPSDFRKER